MDYDVRYSPEAEVHLAALSANERRKVLDEVDQQLMSEPTVPTRKRKKLRQNALADWELRIGDLRVLLFGRGNAGANCVRYCCRQEIAKQGVHRWRGDAHMKWIEITKATGALRDYAKNARNEVVVVTKRGKPVAAIVDVSEYDRESLSLSTNEKFLDILARSRARMEKEGTISADEVRRRFGIPERKRRNTKRGVKSAA